MITTKDSWNNIDCCKTNNEVSKKTDACSQICVFYKWCIESILNFEEDLFMDFYIRYYASLNIDVLAKTKSEEYIKINFQNKNEFFKKLIDYIKLQFFTIGLEYIPENLSDFLLRNSDFIEFTLSYIKENNPKIVDSSSVEYFEELSFLLYLSGINKDYDISSDAIYHNSIMFIGWENPDSIIGLINYYNKLMDFFVSQNDIKSITKIVQILSNVFDIVNNAILVWTVVFSDSITISTLLSEIKKKIEKTSSFIWNFDNNIELLNLLNNSHWKIDLVFSHKIAKEKSETYIKKNNLWGILTTYNNAFSSQIDWYNRMQEANFWNGRVNPEWAYMAFLWNTSILILEMLDSINSLDEKEIFWNDEFREILSKYYKIFSKEDSEIEDLKSLKTDLLNNFLLIWTNKQQEETEILIAPKNLLEKFVSDFIAKKELNQYEIESLYHIIRFSNLDNALLLKLWEYLLTSSFSSYYYEEFKIQSLVIVIKSFISTEKQDFDFESFTWKLVDYIQNNKVASHLISSYSYIYIYMALYYSSFNSFDSKNKTKQFYYKFLQIRPLDEINNLEIKDLFDKISLNIWTHLAKDLGIDIKIDEKDKIKLWKKYLYELEKPHYADLKNEISNKVTFIISRNLNSSDLDISLEDKISKVLSLELFNWFCDISVMQDNWKDLDVKKWYESFKINLYDGYNLYFTYPLIYKEIFIKIYSRERDYVINNIKNIIVAHIKKRELEYDKITWFLNEARFLSDIEKTKDSKNSVMLLRLTNIWDVNKWYSHDMWDKYLEKFAWKLKTILSPIVSTFYRWNWGNFILKLQDWLSKEQVNEYISKLDKEKISLSNWAGLLDTFFPIDIKFWAILEGVWDIHQKIMIAIDRAKTNKEKSCFYDESLVDNSSYKKNMEILHMVQEAIKEDRLIPYFQPIVHLLSQNVYKYEVLVRIIEKDWKILSPFFFLPAVEKAWKLADITNVIINKAFKIVSERNVPISLNITADDLRDENFLEFIDEMVEKYQVDTSNITFELLESAFFWDIKIMLKWLKDRGFKIAMDDYGSDFSNLNRFLDLTYNGLLDYLKIDWEIVKKLREDKNQIISTLLTWTIDAVHKSGVKVVAEYVEDFELVWILTELGVDYGQWYFFSQPISEDQMKKDFWH